MTIENIVFNSDGSILLLPEGKIITPEVEVPETQYFNPDILENLVKSHSINPMLFYVEDDEDITLIL